MLILNLILMCMLKLILSYLFYLLNLLFFTILIFTHFFILILYILIFYIFIFYTLFFIFLEFTSAADKVQEGGEIDAKKY